MRKLILILFLLPALRMLAGGPWLQPKKKGYVQTQFTFPAGYYNKLFLEDGTDAVLNVKVLDTHWQNYLEYGIGKHVNILVDFPVKYVEIKNISTKNGLFGFSNIQLGVKQQLVNKKWLSSLTLLWKMNTVLAHLDNGLLTGYADNFLSINYAIGRGWEKYYFYTELIAVKALHTYSDSWKVNIEAGKKIKGKHWLALTVNTLQSFKNKNINDATLQQTGLYPNNQEYLAYGLKFIVSLKAGKQGITLATYGALKGNYVAHLATLNAGYYWKF